MRTDYGELENGLMNRGIPHSRNDDVGCNQEHTFKVVTATVENQEVHDKSGNEKTDSLKQREVERHVLVHAPAENDDQRRNENGY